MIGIIAKDEVFEIAQELNRRKLFEVKHITGSTVQAIARSINESEGFTHFVVDIEYIRGNIDAGLELLELMQKIRATAKLIAIALHYSEDSGVVRDLRNMGIKDIAFDSGAALKKTLNEIFLRDGLFTFEDDDAAVAVEEVVPPSQMPRATSKAMIPPRPAPTDNVQRAVSVGVVGLGTRIGTTTQAMQLALYLSSQEYSVCLVQLGADNRLEEYVDVLEDNITYNTGQEWFTIGGVSVLLESKSISAAKAKFQYIIFDYGDILQMPDVSAYLEKDIKVAVCGIKPWECSKFSEIAQHDDGDVNYIFSFVVAHDQRDVRQQMRDRTVNTHFAPYTPDYWTYCGADDIYQRIIAESIAQPVTPQGKKGRRKLLGIF